MNHIIFGGSGLKKYRIDFYFSCNTFIPTSTANIKTIGILHDLNHIIVPETMPYTNYIAHRLFMKLDSRRIGFLITNSIATSQKAEKYLGVNIDEVIEPVIDKIFKKRDKISVNKFLAEKGINYPYLLSVATFEPRKNIDKTIEAFLKLKLDNKIDGYKLILVGGKGWKNSKLEHMVDSCPEEIIQLGYVSDEYLAYLYNGAELFVFPSKYEGYGIPVREAMQSGCKVITSDIDELVEVSNGLANYFSLSDKNSYTATILKVLDRSLDSEQQFAPSKMEKLISYIENECKYN